MLEFVQAVGVGVGALVGVLGVIGGLLSLPGRVQDFKWQRRPRGDKGTQFFLMSREDTDQHTIAEFLVGGDLMHFLASWGKTAGGATTLEVENVGEFYRVRLQYALGALDGGYRIVKKAGDSSL